ncbi:MAG: AbrB/MazE/SpoVT family DNA-binding domain-containing protein [Ruminiclostridium sp.]|nr:AbrB/MazE/SpoVT family DNA-binding domain-containing protein [Ruminiclostridium sp.]
MDNDLIYLDTYTLQQDMRIRLPKSILTNMSIDKGKTKLSIFLDSKNKVLVLKPETDEVESYESEN